MLGHAVDATEGNEVLDYYTALEDEYEAQWLRHFAPAGGATSRSEYRETAEDYTETAAGPAPEEEVSDKARARWGTRIARKAPLPSTRRFRTQSASRLWTRWRSRWVGPRSPAARAS